MELAIQNTDKTFILIIRQNILYDFIVMDMKLIDMQEHT